MPVAYSIPHLLDDPYLAPYRGIIERRADFARLRAANLSAAPGSLAEFACAHEFYGLRLREGRWIFREWAPNATAISLVGDFNGWSPTPEFALHRLPGRDVWEGNWPENRLRHGQRYHLLVSWEGGQGERVPAYARRVVQDPDTGLFSAQVWNPPEPYRWRNPEWRIPAGRAPYIYEAHVGMAQEKGGVGTYAEFRENILPRVVRAGYDTLQLMAVMEHPYYGSFGYHVGSFFAASSRFGTPEELKALVDEAHAAGLAVIMDLVHSHAVKNERDGLSRFDGTYYQYFHDGPRGWHDAWDSRCFDYGKTEVLHFLLSNCRYWLDEFHFDGFRFDGVTSMLYRHHGLGVSFGNYAQYFDDSVDTDAFTYLALANKLIHAIRPRAITIAEDVSGMPGIAAPIAKGGAGFDFRLAMGVPDYWFKLTDMRDDDWSMGGLWYALTDKRPEERTVSYVESHDQALVGGKTFFFQMMGPAIYDSMHRGVRNLVTDRAVALHKLARLATAATATGGYLNFMGNEFGHPEWIDFPREGNGYSYDHARRLWHLRDDPDLLYKCLGDFDVSMLDLLGHVAGNARVMLEDEARKLLVFERDDLFFLFNFHPTESYSDLPVLVPPGRYHGVLNTDSEAFGGLGRIEEGQEYPVFDEREGRELVQRVRVYLPSRTAVVLEREVHASWFSVHSS
jgi:1,4-alpha-glucan branching enzyme